MKKLLAASVVVFLMVMPGAALAKDEMLVQNMADMEKAYIPPLFYTSAQSLSLSDKSMGIFTAAWREFRTAYYDYRPDETNWSAHFDRIEEAVRKAESIVATGQNLVSAHDALEEVRVAMLQLRTHNGFSKFTTDKLTAFHHPMESIVLSVKGKQPEQIDETMLAGLRELLDEALFTWDKVEKCPLDAELWGLTEAQAGNYYQYLFAEKNALLNFEAALNVEDKAAIIRTGVALKPNFVNLYTLFGDFARVTAN
jgi:tetratricopeptide (TPR) repeat protein